VTALTPRPRTYSTLWGITRARLERLGVADAPLDPDFSTRGGRMQLTAARWRVGGGPVPIAECRIVRILGAAADIFNVMIFPTDPNRLPVFAAELLAFGGRPRLTFLDLQTPGLMPALRDPVADATRQVSDRFPDVPRDREPPGWAVAYSPGGYLFTRTDAPEHAPTLAAAFEAYLTAWSDLAADRRTEVRPNTAGTTALSRYKTEHVAHSPGKLFLGKVFGGGWSDRFLSEFLYG
jgi:hypothetical protein